VTVEPVRISGVIPAESIAERGESADLRIRTLEGEEVGPFPVLEQFTDDDGNVMVTIEVPGDHPAAESLRNTMAGFSLAEDAEEADRLHAVAARQRAAIQRKAGVPVPPPGSIKLPPSLRPPAPEPAEGEEPPPDRIVGYIPNRAERRRRGIR
jgi:hypothetical protein